MKSIRELLKSMRYAWTVGIRFFLWHPKTKQTEDENYEWSEDSLFSLEQAQKFAGIMAKRAEMAIPKERHAMSVAEKCGFIRRYGYGAYMSLPIRQDVHGE